MKQLTTIFIFVAVFQFWTPIALHAQYAGYEYPDSVGTRFPLYVGISAGVVVNSFRGSDVDSRVKQGKAVMSSGKGISLAVSMKHEFTPFFYLKWALGYDKRGNKEANGPYNNKLNDNIGYVSLPVKFAYQPLNFTNNDSDIQFAIEGGVSVNFESGHASNDFAKGWGKDDIVKINRKIYSALVGANLEFRIAPDRIIFLNGMYYNDLTTLFYHQFRDGKTIGNSYDLKSNGWAFTGGLSFLIGQPRAKKS
ncbi:MAG: outer membrane beta-barrel protein [Bacteroidota bacterium]